MVSRTTMRKWPRMATNLIINEESELRTATDDDDGRLMMDDHATHCVDLI